MRFVGREKELYTLHRYMEEVREGRGKVILVEGPAGIGKTALIEEFLKGLKDVQILKSRGDPSSKYIPYMAFSQALEDYGSLQEIRKKEWKRRISEIVERIAGENRMVFVDEIGHGGGYRIYKELSMRIKGAYFTIRKPKRKDAIWLTETQTEKESVSPYDIEFKLTSHIYDFLSGEERKVVYIENLNYLIYMVGIDRVVDFLHTLRSISQNRHIVLVSGKMEYLTDEEKKLIVEIFDEKVIVEWEDVITPPVVVLTDSIPKEHVLRLVDRKVDGENTLYVSPHGIHPTRLDFEIFEKISEAIRGGLDVAIECLGTLVHYNDRRMVYVWLKAVSDYASKFGRRVYLMYFPHMEGDIEFFLDLIDQGLERIYGASKVNERASLKFYDVIFKFLHNYSKRKPFLLVFEDVQWIDTSSLELIDYLARNIGESKIMLILTYRSEDIAGDRETLNMISKLQGERNSVILRLKPLGRNDIERMLTHLGFDVDFNAIYDASEGNPLLAINMARYFSREDKSVHLPDTIRESIEMQIDLLDDAHLNFIRFLAVAGNEIPIQLVEEFYPEYQFFMDKMDKFFVKLDRDFLRFTYSPYREVVYRNMSKDTRIELHRKIGEWAERRNFLFLAAYHYYMAREERAVKFLKMAADEAVNMLAFQSAIDYLKKAVEIAERYHKKHLLGDLYTRLGEWYIATGDYENAVEAFQNALKFEEDKRVYLGTKIGMVYRLMGNLEKAREVLENYFEIAEGMDRARIIGELGIINWEIGNFGESLENLKEYLNYAKRYKSRVDEVRAKRNIAIVYYMEGKYREALKYASDALKISEDIGDMGELAEIYNILGVINNHLTKYDVAIEYLMKYLDISEKMGNMDHLSRAYNNMGVTYEKMGKIREAEEYYRKAMKIIEKLGNDRLLEGFYSNIGVLYSRHGNYVDGFEYLKRSLQLSEKLNNKFGMCEHLLSLGELCIEMGRYLEAIEYFLRALDIANEKFYLTQQFASHTYLSRVYVALGDGKRAIKHIELAYSLKKYIQEDYLLMDHFIVNAEYQIRFGSRDRALNYLSRAREIADRIRDRVNFLYIRILEAYLNCDGDMVSSKKIFESTIGEYSDLDYKFYVAESYFYYALCLKKNGEKRAKDILFKAIEIYRQLGLKEKILDVEKRFNEI
ncbi:tetratricopeptide repeat protein [Aciduliprofundum sp. MAR08-339]|uniref:tetratricopeptide repeat protein n=1 Tax=Aciduliprofundum sp. (strain MAR08-339) TaxID=673860 RepID=UPI0002A49D10|nr:tetratricopeptide repeat protein [Aciduliprofundum sp. MAR08-339]